MLRFCSVFLLILSACSSLDTSERNDYNSFVNSNVIEKTLRSEAKDLVNVRMLHLNDEYFSKRKNLLKFEDTLYSTFQESGNSFIAIALNMRPGSQFTSSDFQLLLGGEQLSPYKEIAASMELRSLYSFSFPFHRLYLYQIPGSELPNKIILKTVWGTLVLRDK